MEGSLEKEDQAGKALVEFNELAEGMRYRFPTGTTTWTLSKKFFDEPDYSGYHIPSMEEMQRVRLTADDGRVDQTYDGWNLHKLAEGLIYHPNAKFSIGDYFEIKRDGLEPNLRGRLLEINPKAEMWPYKVGNTETNAAAWFSWHELTKIHSVISRERAPKAKKALQEQIARTRAELEALETALEVLEYVS